MDFFKLYQYPPCAGCRIGTPIRTLFGTSLDLLRRFFFLAGIENLYVIESIGQHTSKTAMILE